MPRAARQLVGREEEVGAFDRLLSAPDQLPGAVVLSGEAGIGKTALWLAGVDAAASRVTGSCLADAGRRGGRH